MQSAFFQIAPINFKKNFERRVGLYFNFWKYLREELLTNCCFSRKKKISKSQGKKLYVSFDKTKSRIYGNAAALLVRAVVSPAKLYLLSLENVKKYDGEKIAQLLMKTMFRMFDSAQDFLQFFFHWRWVAAYCVKAGKVLSQTFPNLLHLTCVSHAMLLFLEHVWINNHLVHDCIVTLKTALAKFADRRSTFPATFWPWPIFTRWRACVRCGTFLARNWEVIYQGVQKLELMKLFRKPGAKMKLSLFLSLEKKVIEIQVKQQAYSITLA